MDLKKILGGIVPFIASALPGPFGAIAKTVLTGVFGIGDDTTDQEAAIAQAVVKATPEQMIALKNAEQEFQVRMAELGYSNTEALDRLAKEEMANARQREIEIAKTGKRDLTPIYLAFSAVFGFLACLMMFLLMDVDKWGQVKTQMVTATLATMTTIVVMVYGYYFGSSKGSSEKNAMIDKLQSK